MDEPKEESPSPALQDASREVPFGVRIAAAWAWRLALIALATAGVFWVIVQIRIIVIPVFIAILLTALLAPIVAMIERNGLPRWAGVLTALVVFIAAVSALVTLIVTELRDGLGDLTERSTEAWGEFLHWAEATFGFGADQIDEGIDRVFQMIEQYQSEIWSGALGIVSTTGQVLTGALLTLFSLIFLLIDGRRIWYWVLGFLPAKAHAPVDAAGIAGWVSVGQYVRVQIFVAFVDAVGIGGGAALLGVPLPVPIAILVFLGSFIPFLGAISTGAIAVFVALVYNGPVIGLIMLAVVVLVNQIESHVLQPLVMGSAVRVHPLGVVLAVSTGALLAGVPGALFAVPLAASANAIVNTLVHKKWLDGADPVAEYLRRDTTARKIKIRVRAVARMRRKEKEGR